ncbi:hypothetical protein FB45DRAFT_926484 [Roridomyces roridus]|uniref:SWI/SNF and RSC complexes subunit Ssr4 N-terminal domain-containing protein n=1 Tax=Roridomyces roridus TaxID=1738132 RepID=A0AAD7BKE8_9AGAR|nr:hypothetical protein FB45DRAFT_926484 [Roridomyces roridus]
MQAQLQAEGICLRFPENLGLHREVSMEMAMSYLLRAAQSVNVPYSLGFIDKPQEGQLILIFLPGNSGFPVDGLRYQDTETRYVVPGPQAREIEVQEMKFGFVPGGDSGAWRMRRRYRMIKGGHPQLVLVHYTRGPLAQIIPALMTQPVRSYPLRNINETPMYVLGEKAGQKAYPPGAGGGPGPPPGAMGGGGMGGGGMGGGPMGGPMGPMGGMNFGPQQPGAMVAQQNNNMAMMEQQRRRQEEQRGRAVSGARPPRVEEDDSGDETENISTRSLALTRYRRNHDIMAEVFTHAAYFSKNPPPEPPTYKNLFSKADLDAKTEKLKADIEAMQARAAERRLARSADNDAAFGDVSMGAIGEGIAV